MKTREFEGEALKVFAQQVNKLFSKNPWAVQKTFIFTGYHKCVVKKDRKLFFIISSF